MPQKNKPVTTKPSNKLLRAVLNRLRGNGLISSVYGGVDPLLSLNRLRTWMEDSAIRELIHEAIADYKRDKAERVREQKEDLEKLARACLEDMLTSHTKPKIAKSKTVRSKYIVRAEKLILDQVEEVETSSEIYFRCPPKILEMILPPTPRTTIDVLATQMVNEGAMPLKKAEVIAAIADRAQSDIREVISGSSEFEAQL